VKTEFLYRYYLTERGKYSGKGGRICEQEFGIKDGLKFGLKHRRWFKRWYKWWFKTDAFPDATVGINVGINSVIPIRQRNK
jgi:hypothetical protein